MASLWPQIQNLRFLFPLAICFVAAFFRFSGMGVRIKC